MVEDEMLTCMYPRILEQFAEKVIMWGLLCSFKEKTALQNCKTSHVIFWYQHVLTAKFGLAVDLLVSVNSTVVML
jgi:hypothetical protein